jgi:hypothetical protein
VPVSSLSCAANGVEVYGRTRRADLFSCRWTTRSPNREDQTLLLRYPPSFLLNQCQKEGRCQGFRPEPLEDAIRGVKGRLGQH